MTTFVNGTSDFTLPEIPELIEDFLPEMPSFSETPGLSDLINDVITSMPELPPLVDFPGFISIPEPPGWGGPWFPEMPPLAELPGWITDPIGSLPPVIEIPPIELPGWGLALPSEPCLQL